MSKHTPGPWFMINDHCVGGPESADGFGIGVAACGIRGRSAEEAEANARLIAAAPDLLETLRAIVDAHGMRPGHVAYLSQSDITAMAIAAISKATEE